MNDTIIYLLKVSSGISLMYLFFLLFFSRDTFYFRNRIYLILALLVPFIAPILRLRIVRYEIPAPIAQLQPGAIFPFGGPVESPVLHQSQYAGFGTLLFWLYISIVTILLIRIIIGLASTFRIINEGKIVKSEFPRIVLSTLKIPAFSFFPYIIIPDAEHNKGSYGYLLDHELAHVKQGHTFDLLLSELVIAFHWFNPFVWLIRRAIVLNHEYLADRVSLVNTENAKEYQYKLLGFQTDMRHISLAHSFNSLIKNRIVMINKKPTRKHAALKNLFFLPLLAITLYAFAKPEYVSAPLSGKPHLFTWFTNDSQESVKGVVLTSSGKPLEGVTITSTKSVEEAFRFTTGADGRFQFDNLDESEYLIFMCRGYIQIMLKPVYKTDMNVKMEKDTSYVDYNFRVPTLVYIDGVKTDKDPMAAVNDLGYNRGIMKMLVGKEATDKYGEKAANGVYEITTRKKALEMGLKPPFPRLAPDDFPTFKNQRYSEFGNWVASQISYPPEAKTKKIEGWVSVSYRIELDGSIDNISPSQVTGDPLLLNEVVKVIRNAPRWEAPKNKAVDEPFNDNLTLRFELPDKISAISPYVVVEQMPEYPGGDMELLKFISQNTRYPVEAKKAGIEGRVIVRFIVTTAGNVAGVSVIKGVDPVLDTEAVRVISMLPAFKPGMQNGKKVDVWYMAPITFKISPAGNSNK
jgi:TonB family protein